jgi:hypothetical protein
MDVYGVYIYIILCIGAAINGGSPNGWFVMGSTIKNE